MFFSFLSGCTRATWHPGLSWRERTNSKYTEHVTDTACVLYLGRAWASPTLAWLHCALPRDICSISDYNFLLYYIMLYYIILYYIILYYITLHYIIYYIILHYILQYIICYYIVICLVLFRIHRFLPSSPRPLPCFCVAWKLGRVCYFSQDLTILSALYFSLPSV